MGRTRTRWAVCMGTHTRTRLMDTSPRRTHTPCRRLHLHHQRIRIRTLHTVMRSRMRTAMPRHFRMDTGTDIRSRRRRRRRIHMRCRTVSRRTRTPCTRGRRRASSRARPRRTQHRLTLRKHRTPHTRTARIHIVPA